MSQHTDEPQSGKWWEEGLISKRYYIKVVCANCGSHQEVSFPRGTEVDLIGKECKYCECARLMRSW